ncbi:MAG TPA: universal stress protein [Ktedonobacterales bacterium]|nr:universal stress protein [Ktedonobacterales bacterium]
MGLLERLVPQRKAAKVIEGLHLMENRPGANESTPKPNIKPDMMPLPNEQDPQCKKNVLVVVTGSEQDRELVTLACTIAAKKKSQVYAVFGIEVPRTLPVDAEMPKESERGNAALDAATAVAAQLNFPIEPEIVQSRSLGQSFVDESDVHGCSLIILGLPYRFGRAGQVCLDDTAQFVLKNAPHRVWLVRGEPGEPKERADRGM